MEIRQGIAHVDDLQLISGEAAAPSSAMDHIIGSALADGPPAGLAPGQQE